MDEQKKEGSPRGARDETSDDQPTTTSEGAAGPEPISSPSVITDLTVSDFDFLEQAAMANSRGVYGGLQSMGLNVAEGLLAGLGTGTRNKYQAAQPRIQVQTLPGPSGRRNELAVLQEQIDHIPSPRDSDVAGGAGGASTTWQDVNQASSVASGIIDCPGLTRSVDAVKGAQGAKGLEPQDNASVQANEIIEHFKKEAMEKQSKNKLLEEKLSLMEQKHGKKLLEVTLQLQEKIAKLEAYESIHGQVTGSAASVKGPQAGILRYSPGGSHRFPSPLEQSLDLVGRLKAEREHLEKQRDKADLRYRELESKYNDLIVQINKVKLEGKQELTDVKSTLQFKTFELERMNLILAEMDDKLKSSSTENTDLKNKIEGMRNAMNDIYDELDSNLTRLKVELKAKSSRLEMYEKLENSLDSVIISAADAAHADLPIVLQDISSVPTNLQRRVQQTFDVAKRAFEMEKTIKDQKQQIFELYDERRTLRCQVEAFKSTENKSVSSLIHAISEKSGEIEKLNKRIAIMEKEYMDMKSTNEMLENSLESAKKYQEDVMEMYKACSFHSSMSTNMIPEKSSLVGETLDASPPAPPLRRVRKQTRFADELVQPEPDLKRVSSSMLSTSPAGSYFAFQKSGFTPNQSSSTLIEDASHPVALRRSKVLPNKSDEF